MESADVVIIGGAAIGSATALFLRREGFKGRIAVVEKDPSYQWCATGRSVRNCLVKAKTGQPCAPMARCRCPRPRAAS